MNDLLYRTLLLGACVALGACQSAAPERPQHASTTPVPRLELLPRSASPALENAQWLAGDAFWPGAERLLVRDDAGGLQLLDGQGRELTRLAGRYAGLDHRVSARGALLATLDKRRQQALVVGLSQSAGWGAPLYLPKTAFALEGLCLYRDAGRNTFVFLLGEDGVGEQWLVAADTQPLSQAQRVRSLSLPPESSFCQVDDEREQLYVNEEGVGLWRYAAGAEAPLRRVPVDLVRPFGSLGRAAAGMALVPGGLLALDPAAAVLHLYQQDGDDWRAEAALPLPGLDEPEQISVRPRQGGLDLLLVDDGGLQAARLDWQPRVPARDAPIPTLMAQVQTEGVPSLGDAADDPAIWVNPANPAHSRILGTDKKGGLLAYDLSGRQVQDLRTGRLNNVDVRAGFALGQRRVDLAVATHRDHNSLQLFSIDPRSGVLAELGEVATPLKDIYGLCLFKDRQGAIHAIANDKDGTFLQYRLDGTSGTATGTLVRRFQVASQPEGCVADDRNERLFVGEEDVAVWSLSARADAPATLDKVIGVGDLVHADIEGLALYHGNQRDYLVISSQGNDSYVVVDAQAPYTPRGAFRIGMNAVRGIDGASETDGLEVTSANLGGIWGAGLLVVQDGRKRLPEGNQNYKYVPWSEVARALGLP